MTIKLILGPMFAGKTTAIFNTITEGCDVITHTLDTRYQDKGICSHDGKYLSCTMLSSLNDYLIPSNVNKIIVDEIQFFPDVKNFILKHIDLEIVFVGIISDSDGKMFPTISQVITFADQIEIVSGNCACGGVTRFTRRRCESTDLFLPGGIDSYEPLCTSCFYK